MKLLMTVVYVCLLTACTATPSGTKPDYRYANIEVINVAQIQTQ